MSAPVTQADLEALEALLNQTRNELASTQLNLAAAEVKIYNLSAGLNDTSSYVDEVALGANTVWLLCSGFLVF